MDLGLRRVQAAGAELITEAVGMSEKTMWPRTDLGPLEDGSL